MAKLPISLLPQVLFFVWLTDTVFKVCSTGSRIVVCTIKGSIISSAWSRNWLFSRVTQLTLFLSPIPSKAYPKVVTQRCFHRLATSLCLRQSTQTTERFVSNGCIDQEWVQHISYDREKLVRYSHIRVSFSSREIPFATRTPPIVDVEFLSLYLLLLLPSYCIVLQSDLPCLVDRFYDLPSHMSKHHSKCLHGHRGIAWCSVWNFKSSLSCPLVLLTYDREVHIRARTCRILQLPLRKLV